MSIEAGFLGTLGRDAEQKTAKSGKPYLRFSCRVGDGDGAQWISVMAFDEKATEQASQFTKGSRCYVEGALKLEQWTGQDGATRHGLSCMSWHCRLAEIGRNRPKRQRSRADDRRGAAAPAKRNDFHNDEIGF
jgi:single-stranded DNA-binding protein